MTVQVDNMVKGCCWYKEFQGIWNRYGKVSCHDEIGGIFPGGPATFKVPPLRYQAA